ncbi:excalibur calcium-binding domain-containing protein [Nocardia sp. NPDC005366]|uniref:excalibur calcium-binding domain-containing protein n=1 Tax=Nocardia sp. NPDC005366 TaxID=3156878 RepID=UPI0033A08373
MTRTSRPAVLALGVALVVVLVLTMSGCGKSKKNRHSTAHGPVATATTTARQFQDCEQAWAAGRAPLKRGDSGYSAALDKLDGKEDGTACATRPVSRTTTPRTTTPRASTPTRTPTRTR